MNSEIVVKATGVKKSYEDSSALNGIDLEVKSGQILGFIGPNGAGKSTFLQSVLGLINTEGNIEVLGLNPRKERHKFFQFYWYVQGFY